MREAGTMSRIRGGNGRACEALQGAIRFPASLRIGCREIAQAAKDWENRNRKALAFLHLASIRLMLRKLCNPA